MFFGQLVGLFAPIWPWVSLKLNYVQMGKFLHFLAVGKGSGAAANGGGQLPDGWVVFSDEGFWQLGLGFGADGGYIYSSVFYLVCPSRLI